MSSLTVQNIQGSASSSNTINVASGHKISGAAGSIIAPGQVIQTVYSQITSSETTTSNSYVDTGLHVTITPKYSSSKILIRASVCLYQPNNAGAASVTVKRGSTNLSSASYGFGYIYIASGGGHVNQTPIEFLDSPSTTSATTYRVQISTGVGVNLGTAYISVNGTVSSITLMEIAQ